MQKRLMPQFFVERGTPEWNSIRKEKFTKPNINLQDFAK